MIKWTVCADKMISTTGASVPYTIRRDMVGFSSYSAYKLYAGLELLGVHPSQRDAILSANKYERDIRGEATNRQ